MSNLNEYRKYVLKAINEYKDDWKEKNPYSKVLNLIAPIIPPVVRHELNRYIAEFKLRWRIKLTRAEHLIFNQKNFNIGKPIYYNYRLKRPYQPDLLIKRPLDWTAMEDELNDIVYWARLQVVRMVENETIDFTSELKYEDSLKGG